MSAPDFMPAVKPMPRRVRFDLRVRHFVLLLVLVGAVFDILYGFAEVFLWGGLFNTFAHFAVGLVFGYVAGREVLAIRHIRRKYR